MIATLLLTALLQASPAELADAVAEAHGRADVPAGAVLRGDITVEFGGNRLLDDAEIWFDANGGRVRIGTGDATAVFDGETAYLAPGDADLPRPRFQLLTWPYFAVNALKLDDGGTNLAMMDDAPLRVGGEPMRRMKLTFDAGTGDSPDDWYVLYLDGQDRLVASAYIVTYGTPAEEAEADPHAIVYRDFADVPGPDGEPTGVVLSPSWEFYNWSPDGGIAGEPIGNVTIAGLRFVEAPAGVFDRPEGGEEVRPPESD